MDIDQANSNMGQNEPRFGREIQPNIEVELVDAAEQE